MFSAGYALTDLFYRGMVFLLSGITLYVHGSGFYAEFVRDIATFNLLYNVLLLSLPTLLVRRAVDLGVWPKTHVVSYSFMAAILLPIVFGAALLGVVKYEIILSIFGAAALEIYFARIRYSSDTRLLRTMITFVAVLFMLSLSLLLIGNHEFRFWALTCVGIMVIVSALSLSVGQPIPTGSFRANCARLWLVGREILVFGVPVSLHHLVFWFRSGFDKIYLYPEIEAETFAAYGAIFQLLGVTTVVLGVMLRTYQVKVYGWLKGFSFKASFRRVILFIIGIGFAVTISISAMAIFAIGHLSEIISPAVVVLLLVGGFFHLTNQIFAFVFSFYERNLKFLLINLFGLLLYFAIATLGGGTLIAFAGAFCASCIANSLTSSIYLYSGLGCGPGVGR